MRLLKTTEKTNHNHMNKSLYIKITTLTFFALTSCNKERLDDVSTGGGNKSNIEVPDVCRAAMENEIAGAHAGVYSIEELAQVRAMMTKNNTKYVIPTVFHVYGTKFNNGTTVTYETIVQALKSTNEDFQGLSNDHHAMVTWGDYGIEYPYFEFMEGIEFKLANIDPNGNYTTGVNFYPEKSGFGNGSGYDDEIRKYAWDNTKYLNVYIQHDMYNDRVYNSSGVAWYPDASMTRGNTSRVCFNGSYLDGNNDGYRDAAEEEKMKKELTGNSSWGYRNENFRSVLTHEFGHWLDLKHTFDTDKCVVGGDDTKQGDDVPDTPMVAGANWTRTDKNCRGEITNWQNFMNYTDQYANFTPDQCTRMVAALNDAKHVARKSIWQNASNVILAYGQAGIYISKNTFSEKPGLNDGTVAGEASLTVIGDDSEIIGNVGDNLTHKMTISGLPAGITAKLEKQASNQMKLTLSGKATGAHEEINSTLFDITLDNSIMKKGGTINFVKNKYSLNLIFIETYKYYNKSVTAEVHAGKPKFDVTFAKDFDVPTISIIYKDNAFLIDGLDAEGTKGAVVLCNGSTRNVKMAYSAETVDSKTAMKTVTKSSKPLLYAKGIYQDWVGQTGYIGFGLPSREGAFVYGWIKVRIHENGKILSVIEVGYNTYPNGNVLVGAREDGTVATSVNFEVSKRSIVEKGELKFTAKAFPIDKITSYSWTFTGGTPATSTEQNPTVKYDKEGSYAVTLTVNGSLTKTTNNYITVKKKDAPTDGDDIDEPDTPEKPKGDDIIVEPYPPTVVAIGDKDPMLNNIPANTVVTIIKDDIIVKKIKVLNSGSITVSGLKRGSYVYIYTLNDKLITRGKMEIIK